MMSAGDALHYGQKLRIVANPMVQGEMLDGIGGSRPLYLYSRPVGTTHFAKYSRHQLVAFTDRASYDSVWQVVALVWEQEAYVSCCPALLLLPSLMSCIISKNIEWILKLCEFLYHVSLCFMVTVIKYVCNSLAMHFTAYLQLHA